MKTEIKKVLMAHNYYQYVGGEEESFRSEMSMLLNHGHDVLTFTRSNSDIEVNGLRNKLDMFINTIWANKSYEAVVQLIRKHKPQLAHFQNIFPLLSPSVYYACQKEQIPVVQSLRSYRMICSNGFFFRSGRICEDCMGKLLPWPAIMHACYRESRLQTTAVVSMLLYHRMIKTWESQVDLYIALTDFSRAKFVESGLPPDKIVVKPNYIPDAGIGSYPGKYAVYVGRLSREKGIDTLLEAWKKLPTIPLKIVGDGPLLTFVRRYVEENKLNVELLGYLSNQQTKDVIKESAFLVFPSLLYETFGRTIVEAFVCGKPVIASRHGTSVELIEAGMTRLFFIPGDPVDLAEKVSELWESVAVRINMGKNARACYEEKYTLEKNYAQLIEIYERALRS